MKAVKKLREKRGYTQEYLASKMGISNTTVSMWESGKSKPGIDRLVLLSEILQCSLEEILEESKKANL